MSSQGDSQPSQDSTVTIMEEDRHEVLYFAYGSNLSTDQMLHRCPSSVPIGLGYLEGWRWIINERGYANIVRVDQSPPQQQQQQQQGGKGKERQQDDDDAHADARVYGLLYLLPQDDEAALDGYEGVPHAYKKYRVDLFRITDELGRDVASVGGDGEAQRVTALVYVDDERTIGNVPREEYVGRMDSGLEEAVGDWGMPLGYAEELRGWLAGETQP